MKPVNINTLVFNGKSDKFELFEDLFHTMLRMQPDLTEAMKINLFHAHLSKNALQTFRNINTANRQTLEDILVIFRRKYVKPESQATAKHKWHKLTFDPEKMKLPDFLEELNQGAEKAFGDNAQHMIDSLLYAKLPPKLKRSVNMARLENGTYDEIVTHLERELELNGLEDSDELPITTMSVTQTSGTKNLLSQGMETNLECHYCKKPGHLIKDCRKLKKKEEMKAQGGQATSSQSKYPPCQTCKKTNHSTERCWKGAGAHLRPKPKADVQSDQSDTSDEATPVSKPHKPQSILKNADPKN